MSALFGGASTSRETPAAARGAYVRSLKVPELKEGDQVSKNERIQLEVEGLRKLNRVGSGVHSIVQTRAFGGSMAANYAVDEGLPQGPSLGFVAIMERKKKENIQG